MTESTHVTILRRMTRTQDPDAVENPLTSSRAVRLALIRAANDSVGLVLAVSSVSDDVGQLDPVLDHLANDLMLVELHRDGGLLGLIALDMQLRAAVMEMATMGKVSAQPADARAPTQTDKSLCDPLLTAFLAAFPAAVSGTSLAGWGDGVTHHARITDTRAAGLMMADGTYRWVQMQVTLGGTERVGQMTMVLPLNELAETAQEVPAIARPTADWADDFAQTVQIAPATLTALLHRFSVPLAVARDLKVGSVLPLQGCSVSSVRLLAQDGKSVAEAKLGQSAGMRAVRIEAAPAPDLSDLRPGDAGEPAPAPMMMAQEPAGDPPDTSDDLPAMEGLEMAIDLGGLDG